MAQADFGPKSRKYSAESLCSTSPDCDNVLVCNLWNFNRKGNCISHLAEVQYDGSRNGMPDYIYLLENRLSADQQNALRQVREAARESTMLLFLTGDAVRDLTSGHAVRDLEVAVQGNALKLKKIIERLGGKVWGEDEVSHSLYLCFQGTVRIDVVSTHGREYPKPGKPVFHPASIQEDLRRRDFTVNAMAVSLNEGSYGLLMDPLNGAADIETRTLRLVSNYGFLEDPSLMIRAIRYVARLGWELDPRTQQRYENAKAENVIEALSPHARSYEMEQIGHEDDGLKVLQALENEGWMKFLFPAWTPAKADEEKLKVLHDLRVELQMQGVHPDMSAAQMELLTAKLQPKDLSALKKLMLRPGFVEEWNSLDSLASGFGKVLLKKENATPSVSYRLFTTYDPEGVLWLGFTSKDQAVKARYELFLKTWPEARQRIPHAQMQEMRITPEMPDYNEIIHKIFLKLIDGGLNTPEEIRAFLEPYSPPAPPQITIKRPRAKRVAEAKLKERAFDEEEEEEGEESLEEEELEEIGGDDEDLDLAIALPKGGELAEDLGEEGEEEEGEFEEEGEVEEEEEAPVRGKSKQAVTKSAKGAHQKAAKSASAKSAAAAAKTPEPKKAAKSVPESVAKSKHLPQHEPKHAPKVEKGKATAPRPAPSKKAASLPAKPARHAPPAKTVSKAQVKAQTKAHAKAPAKPAPKHPAPAKKVAPTRPGKSHSSANSKHSPKKSVAKPAKKR
jgi:tRNA nucleotidyltransferase/poly(A) polymerase